MTYHDMGSEMDESKLDRGRRIREDVLGADYVRRATGKADDFNKPMQELVTEFCWGAVWGREGLSRRDRSLINLGMISALNRPHELKTHVEAAMRNGLSKDEIREVFLQVTVYCGVPAGVDSFRLANEVFSAAAD